MSRLSQPFSAPEIQLLVQSARYEWLELRAFLSRTILVSSVKYNAPFYSIRNFSLIMTKNIG